jgi:pimeloyl-ACP methyl ester carboxylesterase
VLLNADTGERVPHWAEYDMTHSDDARRAFMIRPAVRLEPDTRYIAAIRDVVDQAGSALPASGGFAALRDDTPSDEPSIEQRRPLYIDIFTRLADAGIERESLQLAWDFSTASDENITGSAVHMVEEGLALVGPDGPDYVIDNVTMDPAPGIAMRIELTMTVPLFLDDPDGGGAMLFGDDGLPEPSGTAQYPVLVHVPASAADSPAQLMAYGHGLLGSRWEITAGHLEALAAEHNVIVFATDWIGMADDDVNNIVGLLSTGHVDDFHTVPDRLQQGFFNAFAAMRMMQGGFADDPIMQGSNGSMVEPEDPWYFGGSQGGIFGTCYMALSPDVTRGVLAVPGQPYNLLLNRSVNFSQFFTLIDAIYTDKLDTRFFVELVQIEWDRAEPSGFTRHVIHDPLPGSYEKEVLMLVSIGDHQVTTLGAHIMARELGVPQIAPANRPGLFEIDLVEQPYVGSAMIEYEWGLGPEPLENVPMTEGEDPHGKLADVPIAGITVEQFLRTGVIESFCDGTCDPI